MRRLASLACLLLVLSSCTSYRHAVETTVAALNARQANGCVYGHVIAGGGFGGGVTGSVTFVAAVGGMDAALCVHQRAP